MSDEIRYGIRFIDISEEDAKILSAKLHNSDITLKPRRKDKKLVFTAKIELKNTDTICEIIPQVKASKIDVFVSLLPESDSDIYDIPDYVVQVIRLNGVALTISFTYIDDE